MSFKVGDKVRALDNSLYGPLVKDQIYTVKGDHPTTANAIVLVELPQLSGFFPKRFEKVSEEFNVSTATDQELANEYRRMCDKRTAVFDELRNRGYVVRSIDGMSVVRAVPGDNISISKTETKTVTL